MKWPLLVALSLLACSTVTPPPAQPKSEPNAVSPYAALVDQVALARGLKPTTQIVVLEVGDEAYDDAHRRFDGQPASSSSRAFLDGPNNLIYTRSASEADLVGLIVRALQNQHFSFEQRLKRLGQVEAAEALDDFAIGEAGLVRLLLQKPTNHDLAVHVAALGSMTAEKAVEANRLESSALKLPEVAQRRMVLRQLRSLALVTRLYFAGGWELVNRAWQHPPTLLQHFNDHASYVDGSRNPAALPAIPALADHTIVEHAPGANALQVFEFFSGLFRVPGTQEGDSFTATLLADEQRGLSIQILNRREYGRAFVVIAAWESPKRAESFVKRWLEQAPLVTDCGPLAQQREHATVATWCVGEVASKKLIDELLPKIGPLPAPTPPLGPVTLPKLESL